MNANNENNLGCGVERFASNMDITAGERLFDLAGVEIGRYEIIDDPWVRGCNSSCDYASVMVASCKGESTRFLFSLSAIYIILYGLLICLNVT